MEFYKNLEKQLKLKNLTAYQLSKNTSISNSTLTDWKKGKLPSLEKVIELVRYLEISADELLGTDCSKETTEDEELLLRYFRNCDTGNQKVLINAAKSMQKSEQ